MPVPRGSRPAAAAAVVAAVCAAGEPAAAGGSPPADPLSGVRAGTVAWFAPAAPSESFLVLRLPLTGFGEGSARTVRAPVVGPHAPAAGREAVPGDLALGPLDRDTLIPRQPWTPASAPADDPPVPSAAPADAPAVGPPAPPPPVDAVPTAGPPPPPDAPAPADRAGPADAPAVGPPAPPPPVDAVPTAGPPPPPDAPAPADRAGPADAPAVGPPAPPPPVDAVPTAGPPPPPDAPAPADRAGPADAPAAGIPAPHPPADAVPTGPDPVKMVTIPLGQSRRWSLDHQATAVFAATPEIADVRLLAPDLLYVIGRGVGRTSVAVLDDLGLLDEWLVTTVLDLEPVLALLASDPALAGVHAQHFSRGVTLTGEVDSVAAAERAYRLAAAALPESAILENEIEVRGPQQVNLEVQIAEVQRSVTESLGISWEAFNRVGQGGNLFWQVGRPQFAQLALPPDGPLPPPVTGFVEGQPTASVAARYQGSRGAVQGVVDALATAGLANVLARPNLTAVSGETASFFSGGEYPLPVGFRDGVIVFEYKKYGVLLDFVPTVVNPGRITLTVRPEVSETSDVDSLVTVGTEIPVINVRRAETTVELGDGESIVIAGLFRSGSNTVESGLPGLKDLPVFGLLFRQDRMEARETELIVVVTANLVQGGAAGSAAAHPAPATRQIHGYHY